MTEGTARRSPEISMRLGGTLSAGCGLPVPQGGWAGAPGETKERQQTSVSGRGPRGSRTHTLQAGTLGWGTPPSVCEREGLRQARPAASCPRPLGGQGDPQVGHSPATLLLCSQRCCEPRALYPITPSQTSALHSGDRITPNPLQPDSSGTPSHVHRTPGL